jgi:hypothetical protein
MVVDWDLPQTKLDFFASEPFGEISLTKSHVGLLRPNDPTWLRADLATPEIIAPLPTFDLPRSVTAWAQSVLKLIQPQAV